MQMIVVLIVYESTAGEWVFYLTKSFVTLVALLTNILRENWNWSYSTSTGIDIAYH
jgi:hypothetical protein